MIRISPATANDAAAISKLLGETWIDTYGSYLSQATLDEVHKNWQSIEFLTRQIQNTEMYFPVAKQDDAIVGIATARQLGDNSVEMFRLYVSPTAQRKGIGSALLATIGKYFPKAAVIQLHVEVMNEKGQQFYAKHGFKELKRDQEKVVNEVIDQILMEKEL